MKPAVIHYTAPPVVGGVEAVIQAHAQVFAEAGYPLTVIAGDGDERALPPGTDFIHIPEMNSQHPAISRANAELDKGQIPSNFDDLAALLEEKLAPLLERQDNVIVHNILTKHFNLPLTAALFRLFDTGVIHHGIAWCHDFSWTSPNSRSKVFPKYPWDLLRTYRPEMTYVAVSEARKIELAGLLGCPVERIHTIYNGVDPKILLGLSDQGWDLIERLGILSDDLVLLMPVRVTQAKNIEFALQVAAALKARQVRPKLILTGPPDPHDQQSMDYFHELQALRSQLQVEEEMRFVFESSLSSGQTLTIDSRVVGDLFRVSDVLFMPSHREGFGMPVLEAGLAGIQVISTDVPAAEEIGGEDVIRFSLTDSPDHIADLILSWADCSPAHRMRRRVRQQYTWQAIFQREIKPMLQAGAPS